MCHWMVSHFHDWIDYNGKILSQKIRKLLFIKFNNKLALTTLHSAAWNHIDKVDV